MATKIRTFGKKFYAVEVKAIRPAEAPKLTEGQNFLETERTPYLKEVILAAHAAGYSQEDIASSWCDLLGNKSNQVNFEDKKRLFLSEALTVLFENCSYFETKTHYTAFLDLNLAPEKFI